MSLADQASLLLIPSGYKESKIYSVFPTTGVGDFTFNRNSSATRIAKNGLITSVATDIPRLEYPLIDGVVNGCPSVLLEPQRTNLITYSEAFDTQSKSNVTVISDAIISPDGSLNADKLVENSANSSHYLRINTSSSSASVISVFAKKGEETKIFIGNANFSQGVLFDLDLGIIESGSDGTIENYGNGWYKCSFYRTDLSAWQYISLRGNFTTYQGNGVNGVYLYGLQLEQGSFPTSYIPNYGTAAGVTRSAETSTGAGDATTFSDSEGVLMAELLWTATSSNIYISIDDNTANNRILIYSTSASVINALVGSGGVTQAAFTASNQDPTTFSKVAVKYKQNDFALWINGFELVTDTSGNTPIGLSNLGFRAGGGTNPFHGKTKQIQYYNTALTDIQLEEISSWTSFTDLANGQLYTIK